MRTIILSIVIVLTAIALNCEENPSYPFNPMNVYDRVSILDNELGLEPYIWRDYQPVIPEGGNPLYSLIRIYDINSNDIAECIHAESMWLFNSSKEWSGALNEITNFQTSDTLYYSNNEGPRWEPGDLIDVYVQITCEYNTYFLKQENIEIFRTE